MGRGGERGRGPLPRRGRGAVEPAGTRAIGTGPVQGTAARVRDGPAARACHRQDRQEAAARPLRRRGSGGRLVDNAWPFGGILATTKHLSCTSKSRELGDDGDGRGK